jgi:hypothetical protein
LTQSRCAPKIKTDAENQSRAIIKVGAGGKRAGAGRKPGANAKAVGKVKATAPTPRTARHDILPANVMLNNMRRVYIRAVDEEARQLRLPKAERNLSEADKLYNVAQVYAVDAAPYYHPRLAALAAMRPPDPTATSLEQMLIAMNAAPANDDGPLLIEGEAKDAAE